MPTKFKKLVCAFLPVCAHIYPLKGLDPANRNNVTILIDQHIMIDVADIYVDNLYIEGTLELDQSSGSGPF